MTDNHLRFVTGRGRHIVLQHQFHISVLLSPAVKRTFIVHVASIKLRETALQQTQCHYTYSETRQSTDSVHESLLRARRRFFLAAA